MIWENNLLFRISHSPKSVTAVLSFLDRLARVAVFDGMLWGFLWGSEFTFLASSLNGSSSELSPLFDSV